MSVIGLFMICHRYQNMPCNHATQKEHIKMTKENKANINLFVLWYSNDSLLCLTDHTACLLLLGNNLHFHYTCTVCYSLQFPAHGLLILTIKTSYTQNLF